MDGLLADLPLPAVLVEGGVVVAANPAVRRLGGRAEVGTPLVDWFEPEDTEAIERALTGEAGSEPPFAKLRAGEQWVAVHAAGDRGDGPQLVVLRDASDERFVRAALDAVADSTFVLDAAGAGRWRSARLRERSGVSDEVAARTPAGERIHPEDLPVVFETFASVTEKRPLTVTARSRAVDDDDRWEWIELVVFHRLADEVLRGYLVQVHNLDEGRTLKTALSEADADLLSLTEAAPVGIVVADPAGQIVYRNPAARALLGPDVQSFGHTDWLSLARPDHRDPLAEAFDAALRRGRDGTVTAAFGVDGAQPSWLRLRVEPQRSATGDHSGVIATIEDVTEQVEARAALEAAEERMRHLATHDPLTGLPNRAALNEELARAANRHGRTGAGLAVLFCDLDGFKPVNDRLGHAGGDAVLVEVARRLQAAVRATDFVARLGGDEFVVLCEGTGADPSSVDELVARLHDHVEAPIGIDGDRAVVGVSVGVAVASPGEACVADELLLRADAAMYEAKAASRR